MTEYLLTWDNAFWGMEDDVAARITANTPEEAAGIAGGELGEKRGDGSWGVLYRKELFNPPSPEEKHLYGDYWIFRKGSIEILIDLELEEIAEMLLKEII